MKYEQSSFWNPFGRKNFRKGPWRTCIMCEGRGKNTVFGLNRMPVGEMTCKTCKGKGKVRDLILNPELLT